MTLQTLREAKCPKCDGTGKVYEHGQKKNCFNCGGTGDQDNITQNYISTAYTIYIVKEDLDADG